MLAPSHRVMFVAPGFPPIGGGGVQRALKWVHWLPEFGWSPAVVSMKPRTWYPLDRSLIPDIRAGTPVVRAPVADAWMVGGLLEAAGLPRLGRLVRSILSFPDGDVGWVVPAVAMGVSLARRFHPQVLLSSGPPWSAHLAGWVLARRLELPWVADFRDEWTTQPGYGQTGLRARWEKALEERWLRDAQAVVATSDGSCGVFARAAGGRVRVIRNAHDDLDMPGAPWPAADRGETLRLLYAGSLYGASDPRPIIETIGNLTARGVIPSVEIHARLVGASWTSLPSAPWLDVAGYIPHRDVIEEYRRAHVLLMILRDNPRRVLGKLYEYLATGRPSLFLGDPAGETARLLREARGGLVVPGGDEAALEQAIICLHRAWREERLPGGADPTVVSQWTRRRGAEQLAALLDELVG